MTKFPWEEASPEELARKRAGTSSSPYNVLIDGLARCGYYAELGPSLNHLDYLYFYRSRTRTRQTGGVLFVKNKERPDSLDAFGDDWRYMVTQVTDPDDYRTAVYLYDGTDVLAALNAAVELCWSLDLADAQRERAETEKVVPFYKLPVVDWTDRSIGGPVTKRNAV